METVGEPTVTSVEMAPGHNANTLFGGMKLPQSQIEPKATHPQENLPDHSRQIATLEIEQYQSQKPRLAPWLSSL
jgi:hypothetical protein